MPATFSIRELFSEPPIVVVVEVGASIVEGTVESYAALVERGGAKVIGFEPDAIEREKLEARYPYRRKFLPYFIGRGGPATFHKTNWVYTGSLLEPNTPLLEHFQMLNEFVLLTEKHPVSTHRLDEIPEIDAMDLLKIDVQGGELAVLEGADRLLKECLVIQTEVEFIPLYKEQPLFADVDAFLRARGFQFHRFLGFGSRSFKPFLKMDDASPKGSQQIWSDALYVRDFMSFDRLPTEQLVRLAVLLHDVFCSFDLCLFILREIDHRCGGGAKLQLAYVKRLNEDGHGVGLSMDQRRGAT